MAEYGYLVHSSTVQRDFEAVDLIFGAVPCGNISLEQLWCPGETNRPALDALIAKLMPGDVLYVHSLDRFGEDVDAIVEVWDIVAHDKQAHVATLEEPIWDTRTGDMTLTEISQAAQAAITRKAKMAKEEKTQKKRSA